MNYEQPARYTKKDLYIMSKSPDLTQKIIYDSDVQLEAEEGKIIDPQSLTNYYQYPPPIKGQISSIKNQKSSIGDVVGSAIVGTAIISVFVLLLIISFILFIMYRKQI